MSLPESEHSIYISSVTLKIQSKFGKPVDNVIFHVGGSTKEISSELHPGNEHEEVFHQPIKLSPRDQVSVSMQYDSQWWCGRRSTLRVTLKQNKIAQGLRDDGRGKIRYMKFHRNILITIVPAASASSPPRNAPLLPVEASSLTSERGPHETPSPSATGDVPQDSVPVLTTSPVASDVHDSASIPTANKALHDAPLTLVTNQGHDLISATTTSEVSQDPTSTTPSEAPYDAVSTSPTASKRPPEDPLQPTTDEILRVCPRFRLLVIGNTGVGKSTLIQKVFGVREVIISEDSRGRAEIDREFVAADNGLFVVHDSVGLEAGERGNFDTVKHFISERREKEELKDKLHAVWVCLAVPYAKGRLLEAGMEEFLRDRKKILGDIPIVIVLTKLDLLDGYLLRTLRNEGVEFKSIAEATPELEPRKTKFLDEYCTQPLLRLTEEPVPHVPVSTKSKHGLEGTIPDLVKLTTSEIRRYIKAGLSSTAAAEPPSIEKNAQLYVAEMAQRASDEAKVDLIIEIGKKRYWKNLGASFSFSSKKVEEYLLVIHQDIVQIWNFNDPDKALQDDSLKVALLETSDLEVHKIRSVDKVLSGIPVLGPMAADPTTAVIALPVGGAVVLGKICKEIHQASKTIAKRFMAYTVDLVYIMKILFILVPQEAITAHDVDLAFKVYQKLLYRDTIHAEIKEFRVDNAIRRDMIMDRIEELIRQINVSNEKVSSMRRQIEAGAA